MKKIFIILSLLVLVSCSESLDIQLEPEVSVFVSSDKSKTIRLTPDDKEYVELNEWLREHSSGWYAASGRYHGGVYIKSGDYGIQITDMHVVLYSTTSSEPKVMYIQKHDSRALSEIRNMGN